MATEIAKEGFPTLRALPDERIYFTLTPRKDFHWMGPKFRIVDSAWESMSKSSARVIGVSVEDTPKEMADRECESDDLARHGGHTLTWYRSAGRYGRRGKKGCSSGGSIEGSRVQYPRHRCHQSRLVVWPWTSQTQIKHPGLNVAYQAADDRRCTSPLNLYPRHDFEVMGHITTEGLVATCH